MAQITWRNIDAPDFTGASNILAQAKGNFTDAASGLLGIGKMYQEQDARNVSTLRENNKQDVADFLASFKTPEALAAAEQQGLIQQKIAATGGAIDRDYARNALDERLDYVRTQAKEGQEYKDYMTELGLRPLIAQGVLKGYETGQFDKSIAESLGVSPNAAQHYESMYGAGNAFYDRKHGIEDQENARKRLALEQQRVAITQAEAARNAAKFKQEQERQKQLQIVNDLTKKALRNHTELGEKRSFELKSAVGKLNADGANIPVNSAGVPDFSGLDKDERYQKEAELDQLLRANGYNFESLPSETQVTQSLTDQIVGLNAGWITPDDVRTAVSALDSALKSRSELSTTDNERLAKEKERIETEQESNIFKGLDQRDVAQELTNLAKEYQVKDDGIFGLLKSDNTYFLTPDAEASAEYFNTAKRIMSNGVDLDGSGVPTPVPTNILKVALESAKGTSGFDIEEAVKKLMLDQDAGTQLTDYRNSTEALKNLKAVVSGQVAPSKSSEYQSIVQSLQLANRKVAEQQAAVKAARAAEAAKVKAELQRQEEARKRLEEYNGLPLKDYQVAHFNKLKTEEEKQEYLNIIKFFTDYDLE